MFTSFITKLFYDLGTYEMWWHDEYNEPPSEVWDEYEILYPVCSADITSEKIFNFWSLKSKYM